MTSAAAPTAAWAGADLSGRQILIVGAQGAIGRATALAAAARGASVVLLGRRVAPLEKLYDEIEAAGGAQPALYPMNLEGATPADYAELGERLLEGCGRLDGVVYAAGRLHGLTPIEQFEPEEWLRTLQINLHAPFLMLQALAPALRASADARVLFLLDDAERATRAYWGAYGVSQAGLRSLIGITGKEWSEGPAVVAGVHLAPVASAFRRKVYVGESADGLAPPARYAELLTWLLAHLPRAQAGQVVDATQWMEP